MSEIYLYNHSKRSLVQKPGMEEPKNYTGHPENGQAIQGYLNSLKEYEQHIALLNKCSCNWLDQKDDGQERIEGLHFVIVDGKAIKKYPQPPLPPDDPVGDQEAIWGDVFDSFEDSTRYFSPVRIGKKRAIEKLQSKYIIKRKA